MRISEFVLKFVLNAAWQILAISVVASLVSWLLRNGPARYLHTLWVVAMLACLFVPLATISNFQIVAPSTQRLHSLLLAVRLLNHSRNNSRARMQQCGETQRGPSVS